jgi:hypothetical protein
VINSATEIIATWLKGVPPVSGVKPILSYGNSSDNAYESSI